MSDEIVLTLKTPLSARADFSTMTPDRLAPLSESEMAQLTVVVGGESVRLADLCQIRGAGGGRLRLVGDFSRADLVGAGMASGALIVEGAVGADAGRAMKGGQLDIGGDAGPRLGGRPPEQKRGMSGGEILVRGSAAEEAGVGMRRGLIAVKGSTGPRAGLSMLAGTVVGFGAFGTHAGLGSRRGSIVALDGVTPPASYRLACTYQPVHLRVLLRRLQQLGFPVEPQQLTGFYRRYSGDLGELAKGEILEWTGR